MFSHMCIFVCDRSIIHKLQYNTHNKLLCKAFCVMLYKLGTPSKPWTILGYPVAQCPGGPGAFPSFASR